jgi:hypothetical protein
MPQTAITSEEAKRTSISELFDKLGTGVKGLSTSEAEQRLQLYRFFLT